MRSARIAHIAAWLGPISADAVNSLAKEKATGSSSLADFVKKLARPRAKQDDHG